MTERINLVVGFDQREAVAYHVFCQSVIDKASLPVQFLPLNPHAIAGYTERHADGSNVFIYTRFLTPYLMGYKGWAIFADGDMICNADIAELWKLRDPSKAVLVAKHDYKTKAGTKYLGNKNENYPRKNWSSVILWNCEHPDNRQLTPAFVEGKDGAFLHRFKWLEDEKIGEIPKEWNWLAIEYEPREDAKLIHYTLGTPCFRDYRNTDMADKWLLSLRRVMSGMED
jgi:lipopolysaccharide biosynthesis glycosyltransferase